VSPLVCPDVSEFQTYLSDAFGRRLLIMRVSFGAHYQDRKFLANAASAAAQYRRGEIDGVILYTVYLASATPAEQYAYAWKLIGPTVPPWLIAVMIDVESWRGTSYAISGNHSKPLNTLYGLHAHKMGSWASCIGYGNAGDLAVIWPGRDTRCWVILADYSSSMSTRGVPRVLGKQYTDGQTRWPVPVMGGQALPRSSAPFGPCDHNVFPGFATAKALRARLRPARPATAPVPAPKPPPVIEPYYAQPGGPSRALVSANRQYGVGVTDDGRVVVNYRGKHHATVQTGA
jgi:hypothetical protein